MELNYGSLFGVFIVALLAPLIVNLAPQLRLPAVALEIVIGIIVGPSVLGWIQADAPVTVLSTIGLGYLLFLAGMEINPAALQGRLRMLSISFGISVLLAVTMGLVLHTLDTVDRGLFIAVVLLSTSLSLVVPILKDLRETETEFGQLVLATSSTGEFGALLLLSVFFNTDDNGIASEILLFVAFAVIALMLTVALAKVGNSLRALDLLERLGDTPAQLGVRFLLVVMAAFMAVAFKLGFEAILAPAHRPLGQAPG